jgi:hypothetical protein
MTASRGLCGRSTCFWFPAIPRWDTVCRSTPSLGPSRKTSSGPTIRIRFRNGTSFPEGLHEGPISLGFLSRPSRTNRGVCQDFAHLLVGDSNGNIETFFSKRFVHLPAPAARCRSAMNLPWSRGDRALSQQSADSTERGVLVTAVRRVRVLGVLPEHYLVPLRCGSGNGLLVVGVNRAAGGLLMKTISRDGRRQDRLPHKNVAVGAGLKARARSNPLFLRFLVIGFDRRKRTKAVLVERERIGERAIAGIHRLGLSVGIVCRQVRHFRTGL